MGIGIDIAVVLCALTVGVTSFLDGFMKNVLFWGGIILGAILAPILSPFIADIFNGTPQEQFVTSGILIMFFTIVGGLIGKVVASTTKFVLPPIPKMADRIIGGFMGVFLIFVLAWLVLPLLETGEGTTADWHAESEIAKFLDTVLPDAPIGRLERIIGDAHETAESVRDAVDQSQDIIGGLGSQIP